MESDTNEKIENVRKNLYGIWGQSKQTQSLFNYVKKENAKGGSLIITGFDSRHSSNYSKKYYITQLDSVVKTKNLSVLKESEYTIFKKIASDLISKEYGHEPKKSDKDIFFKTLDKILTQLEMTGHSDSQFWLQELKNLKGNANSVWNDKDNRRESVNQRDRQMADNLLWLVQQKFKNEKIIVWAANYHIAKNDNQVVKQKYYDHEEHETMGEILAPLLGDKMVNIGFTSSSGQYTDVTYKNTKRDIKVSPNSLEGLLDNTQYHYGFINFKKHQLDNIEPFTMSPFAHFELQGKWNHVFDGVFYIRRMTPSEF
jgi:erythromycin esterase